ncbi:11540_t:CDS:2, partial [Cetraspora pellucida]
EDCCLHLDGQFFILVMLYEKFNKEHLEILEIYNDTETKQILYYTHNSSVDALTLSEWPTFYSCTGIVVAAKNPILQQQSFNNYLNRLYEKFIKEYLEILENYNNTETNQIL